MKRFLFLSGLYLFLSTSFLFSKDNYYSEEASPPVTPRWAFEPWIWEDNGNTKGSVMELIYGYEYHNIPAGVILIDSPWQTGYNTFEPDSVRYPDFGEMIDQLHKRDYRVIFWMTGMFNISARGVSVAKHPHYDWLKEQEYVVDNGTAYDWWKGKGIHIDLTNEEATDWWHKQMDNVLKHGIDGWKMDGSPSALNNTVLTSKGEMPIDDFLPLYYKDVYEYTTSQNPNAIIFARPYSHQSPAENSFEAPIPSCAVGWCGDFEAGWKGMQFQMDNIYRSAQAGYGALSCEVGGYRHYSRSNKPQFIRYTQFGAFTPVMINGGVNGGLSNHLPWFYDDETVDIYRYYATLHSELVPYIFSYNVEAHLSSETIIIDSDIEKAQHKLGEEIFVSPVVTDDLFKHVHFPDQDYWIDYWKQEKVYSPDTSLYYSVSMKKTPLFIKAGAIIPMNVKNDVTGHGNSSSQGKQTLMIYPYKKSQFVFHQPLGDGVDYTNITITVDEQKGTINVSGSSPENYRLRIKCFEKPQSIKGVSSWEYSNEQNVIVCDVKGDSFSVEIRGLIAYSSIIE